MVAARTDARAAEISPPLAYRDTRARIQLRNARAREAGAGRTM